MPPNPATTVLHFLRRLVAARAADGTSDGELVARFVQKRDEAAFTELLRRHGPMVLGVCRRVLGNSADADDAFQATFLVLVRKAGSLTAPQSIANWLHGVALRTALKARAESAKRRQREREKAAMTEIQSSDDPAWRDLRPVLDEEIQHLPARYRAAFVLCHLEGKSNEEAAKQLGCSKGTIGSRLSRARERLRARLTKRGITQSAVALVATIAKPTASATVPSVLAATILKAALTITGGGMAAEMVSTQVITLTEGVLQAMFMTKLKIATAVVLALGLVAGAGLAGYSTLREEPTQDSTPNAPQVEPRPKADDREERRADTELQNKLQPLMEKRLAAAKIHLQAKMEELVAGKTTVDVLLEASRNLLKAQQEMSDKPADRLKMLETHFLRLKYTNEILEKRFQAGTANTSDVAQSAYERYDAEIALERFKAKLGNQQPKGEPTKALFEGTEVNSAEQNKP